MLDFMQPERADEPGWQGTRQHPGLNRPEGGNPLSDSTPDKFRRSLAADVALWTPVVKALGLKID